MLEDWILPTILGGSAIIYAILLIYAVLREDRGTERMIEISNYIKEGAVSYMKQQYRVILVIAGLIAVLLYLALGLRVTVAYILGALSSTIAGFTGMYIAVNANVRTANAARTRGLARALRIAFNGGSVLGFLVVGLGLLGVTFLYELFSSYKDALSDIAGFGFGASTVALFARVGGGIYTKAADIGADLVGKVEAGIPEDDPRNPGVIADNVGDNVGDCAGMGADLFESYVGSIISAMILGALTSPAGEVLAWTTLPLLIAGIGVLSSIIASLTVRVKEGGDPSKPLTASSIIAAALTAGLTLPASIQVLGYEYGCKTFLAVLSGLVVGVIVGLTSDYFTNRERWPARKVAEMSQMGPALTILTGLSMGFLSTLIPIIGISIAGIVAYLVGPGIYGVAMAAVGMLSVTGIIVSADAYGPIVDNAAGIAEQAGLEEEVREIADKLDSAGNTMKSISKGFAIGSAALTALALLAAYVNVAGVEASALTLLDPKVIGGIFIGSALPALFTAVVVMSVSDSAFVLIDEIRRQFRENPGILEWKEKPDYGRAVGIVTSYALKRLILPGMIAIVAPLIVGFVLGPSALGGMLAGAIVTGLVLGLFQGNVGNTWDNAKKYVELGNLGGKGSETHKATVIGDTVGDPLKDSSGPSINILIKLMSIISLVFAPLILQYNLLR